MTEGEWTVSEDPQAMLRHLISDRKLCLFSCECIRLARICDQKELSEHYELAETGRIHTHCVQIGNKPCSAIDQALSWASGCHVPPTPKQAAAIVREVVGHHWRHDFGSAITASPVGPGLLTGYNGRGFPMVNEVAVTWYRTALEDWQMHNDSAVMRIAEHIYGQHAFDEIPILADALTEAGCDDEQVLLHLRGFEQCPTQERVIGDQYCPACGASGRWRSGVGFEHEKICMKHKRSVCWEPGDLSIIPCRKCNGDGVRPLSTPHCRGCWALDLVLSK